MVKPLTARHIGQAVGLGGICGADFLGQQTEEDGCHFCAGDVAVRLNVAVRVADNVSIVVIAVQTGRYIIRNGNGGLAAASATAAGVLRPDCIQVVRLNIVNNNLVIRLERSTLAVSLRIPATECVAAAREGIFTL